MKPFRAGMIALAFAGYFAAAAPQAMAGKADDTLTFVSRSSISTMDPYFQTNQEASTWVGGLVWDTLIYQDPKTQEYQPLLAKSWKWLNDTSLQFELRDDVKFQDGVAMTADDVVYTANFVINPANKVTLQDQVNWMTKAEKTGPNTVVIHLKQPFAPALQYLSQYLPILPNGFFGPNGEAGANGRLVGTGPYKVTKFAPGNSIEMARYDGYFARNIKPAKIGKIVYRVIPDTSTQIAELIAGRIDWIWNVTDEQAQRLATIPSVKTESAEVARISVLVFDQRDKAGGNVMQNPKVRQAIAHAIDRAAIAKNVIGPGSNILTTPCYRTWLGCATDIESKSAYDPELAKKLLAEAGYPNGLTLRVLATNQRPKEWTLAITGYLNKIGIKTDVEFLQYTAILDRYRQNAVDIYNGTYSNSGMMDVSATFSRFFGGVVDDLVQDKQLVELNLKAVAETDNAKRMQIYRTIQDRIISNNFWLPLFTIPGRYAYSKDLNYTIWPDENPRFYLASWN